MCACIYVYCVVDSATQSQLIPSSFPLKNNITLGIIVLSIDKWSVSQKQYLWTIWILQSFLAMNASHRTLNPSPGSRLQQRLQLQWPPLYRGDSSGRYSLLMDKDSAPIDDRDSSFSLFWLIHIRLCDGMLVKPRSRVQFLLNVYICVFLYIICERENWEGIYWQSLLRLHHI